MSSALASARKRSIPQPGQQPPLPGKTVGSAPTPVSNTPTGGNGQLTLNQIIDIYGRRILQLEKQVLELSGNGAKVVAPSAPSATSAPLDLAKHVEPVVARLVEPLVAASIETRLKDFAGKEFVPMIEELNSRNELLAKEIVELKDLLLNLQSFTMTTHKKILDIALEPFVSEQVGATPGDNILDDVAPVPAEVDEEHEAILADLEKSLASIPEEFEINPGFAVDSVDSSVEEN